MLQIRTVLVPVDFSDLDARTLNLAVEVCRSFGARLILHHNLGVAPLGVSASWMWQQEHKAGRDTEKAAAERLHQILASLPDEVRAEARISGGVAGPAILAVEEEVEADLVLMGSHGTGTDDHASVAEQIVERSRCPVLVLHTEGQSPALHLAPKAREILTVLVPTDFSPGAERVLGYAFELARVLPLRIHLLHVVTPGRSLQIEGGVPMNLPEGRDVPSEMARLKLEALVPEDLRYRVAVHVEVGDPAERIAYASARLGASCIVMGAHARGFLRRIFTRDTSREMLHRAPCPVWFVPGSQAA